MSMHGHALISIHISFLHSYIMQGTFLLPSVIFVIGGESYGATGLSACHEQDFHLLFKLMIERREEQ